MWKEIRKSKIYKKYPYTKISDHFHPTLHTPPEGEFTSVQLTELPPTIHISPPVGCQSRVSEQQQTQQ